MKNNKEVKISYWARHLTTVVSVTLVLVLLGIIAMTWLSADTETRRLKERIELCVVMADSVPEGQALHLADKIGSAPYAQGVEYVSKEQALRNWTEDSGEDLEQLFGVNPLSEEILFGIRAGYASPEKIAAIKEQLEKEPGVEGISIPDADMVDSMNRNIAKLTWMLGIVAAIMLVISFVLINNTVRLTIYSRRFTIHTMQLVGATNGYIRRPVILGNMVAGLISGLLASAVFAIAMAGAKHTGTVDLAAYVSWWQYGAVAGGLVIAGMLLCALTAWISANAYLRKDYDSLFQ